MIGKPVVLINRTSRPLFFVKDSRTFIVEPGRNPGFTSDQVRFAKSQNPLFGSEDYLTRKFESLIGVEGTKDPLDPLSDDVIAAAQEVGERFDRSSFLEPKLQKVQKIRGRVVRSREEVATSANENAMAHG